MFPHNNAGSKIRRETSRKEVQRECHKLCLKLCAHLTAADVSGSLYGGNLS